MVSVVRRFVEEKILVTTVANEALPKSNQHG